MASACRTEVRPTAWHRIVWIFVSLILLATASSAAEEAEYPDQPAWFKQSFLDLREDVAEAKQAGKRVLLYFHQDGCPYCARLLRENFGNRRIAEKTRKHFDVIAINIWGDREVTDLQGRETTEKKFSAQLGVQYTPTLIFLDEQGRVVARLNGYYPPHKFEVVLDYVAGHMEKKQRLVDYYRSRDPQPASGKLHEEPFFLPHPLKLANRPKGRMLAVLFEQATCEPCDELHGDHFTRRDLVTALTNLDVAQVDVWSSEEVTTPAGQSLPASRWAKELGVRYTPSWVFFDDQGREVFRVDAWVRPFHLHGIIDYVATRGYLSQPNMQRFLQHRSEVLREKGFKVDLMK